MLELIPWWAWPVGYVVVGLGLVWISAKPNTNCGEPWTPTSWVVLNLLAIVVWPLWLAWSVLKRLRFLLPPEPGSKS